MINNYSPELGQMAFGQPWQEFAVSELWEAALRHLGRELERVMWNRNQEEYLSPLDNTSNSYECEAFSVLAYSWDEEPQDWNFKWRDVRISWYKRCGRGMSSNQELTPQMAATMLDECLPAVSALDTCS